MYIYIYIHTNTYVKTINEKEVVNLKERNQRYMKGLRGGNDPIIISKIKEVTKYSLFLC